MTIYISDGTWFKYGTECQCINCWQMGDGEWVGVFKGRRICKNPKSERREYGEEYIDEELCPFDEFYINE